MIRILQLLNQNADFQTQRCVAALSTHLGNDFTVEVRRIGPGGDYRNAILASLQLRSKASNSFDLIHAWGNPSLLAAVMGTNRPLLYTPLEENLSRSLRWLHAVRNYRPVQVICPSATLQKTALQRGIPLEHCHLIRPGVDLAKAKRRRDNQLRKALGLDENDCVLLAAGESTRPANHRIAVWATSILNQLDPRYKLLLWGRGDQTQAVANFAGNMHQSKLLHIAQQRLGRPVEYEELLPAADMVLVTADQPVPTLPISISMASGLPIVATSSYTVGELLEDHHTALLVKQNSPRLLALRIVNLREAPSLQWSLADKSRAEAYEFFSLSRFLDQYRTAYHQYATTQTIALPA